MISSIYFQFDTIDKSSEISESKRNMTCTVLPSNCFMFLFSLHVVEFSEVKAAKKLDFILITQM
jgi:hypothetical protein